MATRKAAAAPKAEDRSLPVNAAELLRQEIEGLANRVAPGTGNMIRTTKDKNFVLPDGTSNPGPLAVVILDFMSTNTYFDRPYKEGEVAPPACFSISLEPTNMAPSANSPNKQASACKECPMNQFGSHPNGRGGKACSNNRLLAVVMPGGDADSPIYLLKVSPTAVKGFDSYVASLKGRGTAPIAVVTEIFFDPSVDYQALRFGNPTANPDLEGAFARKKEAREMLSREPDVSGYEPPRKTARR